MENELLRFKEILLAHLVRDPLMGPEDCAKLVYQSEFAGEHMIASAEESLKWIEREMGEVPAEQGEIYESIGSGVARLHLGPAKAAGMTAMEINRLFISGKATGSKEKQEQKLDLMEDLCREGKTAFSREELSEFLIKYRAEGCPPLRHSERFRQAYEPHYRVVRKER